MYAQGQGEHGNSVSSTQFFCKPVLKTILKNEVYEFEKYLATSKSLN